jgi:hypothetical protein
MSTRLAASTCARSAAGVAHLDRRAVDVRQERGCASPRCVQMFPVL